MVFQSYAIFPHLSVYENVAFGLRVRGLREPAIRSRVEAMLELTELRGLGGRSPDRLSGGQQQRVALARALVTEPKVLLFDEPLSNLDAKLREQMRAEVRAIQRRLGITSLYVTHDQTEAMALSDRIVVMRQGRVEQVGTPVEVYARPTSRFVADFVGRVNFLPAEAAARGRIGMRVGSMTVTLAVDDAGPRPIERGLAVIRPEALRLVPSGDAPEDWPRARVRRVLYLGGVAEYEVDAGGVTLLVSMADPLATRLFAEGEPVAIRFPERPVTLVPDP
jgi:iron(III) transport system ATP-binding protein